VKLRDYQQDAVANTRAQYEAGRRAPCLVMPTGAGKTPVAAEIIRLALAKGNRVLFAANRIELLNQAVRKLADAGITDVRVIQADNDNQSTSPVTVVSIPTLATKRWQGQLPLADLVVLDEVHHLRAEKTWLPIANNYASSRLLGLTATPARGDNLGLGIECGGVLDSLVVAVTVKELTARGFLVPCKVYAPPRIMASRELAMSPVAAYMQRTPGQKAIVFCSTVEAARAAADEFVMRGIRARWVCGESDDRQEVIEQFARRDFDVLVNVSILVEGFDDPGIEAAILAKRFTHVGPYLQAIGRILRPFPGKQQATVVDLCGSALVHGTPDIDREYTLGGKGINRARQPIRQCQGCAAVFTQAGDCPFCGFQAPPLTRAQAKALGIKLEEVTAKSTRTSWPMRAKRRGSCAFCAGVIEPGAWIVYSKTSQQAAHTSCAARRQAA
jgi:DNA repair protein RadD